MGVGVAVVDAEVRVSGGLVAAAVEVQQPGSGTEEQRGRGQDDRFGNGYNDSTDVESVKWPQDGVVRFRLGCIDTCARTAQGAKREGCNNAAWCHGKLHGELQAAMRAAGGNARLVGLAATYVKNGYVSTNCSTRCLVGRSNNAPGRQAGRLQSGQRHNPCA